MTAQVAGGNRVAHADFGVGDRHLDGLELRHRLGRWR
jgi:hypothetical protein